MQHQCHAARAVVNPVPLRQPFSQQLGVAIGEDYCETMTRLGALIESHLSEPAILAEEARQLRDAAITSLVHRGYEREDLSTELRKTTDVATQGQIQRVDQVAWQAMSKATMSLMFTHNALSQLLSSFNVLTQYAAFELLRAQNPAEADRLGLP